ncbi:MFS transporter [Azospirillum thermophilum]|uniref:Major facilitator superfamily (MFS) profile domain-containing protein n=1 Tax=Azospirillum thermophilum TaxID=2202148 RepID=A0A2S2CUB8_9PROT|nr:MFS transporter [Azospirillum thermophilum]AWK88114.1 hypothetical protein DEW08_18465 [Azospirillum thermophilum]
MDRALAAVLAAVTLDAIGIGIAMPVLPGLLRDLTGRADVATLYGLLLATYGAMQFLFAPLLGSLSDRFGRRPVLLVSLAGAAADYLVITVAPALWVLLLGRILSGITGASATVAAAAIADTTQESERAGRYGLMSACFGLGIIAGPLLGGLLGAVSLRAPFLLAALLHGLGFLLVWAVLPETRRRPAGAAPAAAVRLLPSLPRLGGRAGLGRLVAVFVALQLVGQIPAALWTIYSIDRFGWSAGMVGVSLAVYGLLHLLSQAMLTGPVTRRLGERGALLLGMGTEVLAYGLVALAASGWMVFALTPLLAFGAIAGPALRALTSFRVGEDGQGELQGTLTGLASLAGVAGPVAATALYAATAEHWIGTVWLAGAVLYLLACLLVPPERAARGAGAPVGNFHPAGRPRADGGPDRRG